MLLSFGFKIGMAGIKVIGTICAVFMVILTLLVAYRQCRIPYVGIYITLWNVTGYVLYFIAQMITG